DAITRDADVKPCAWRSASVDDLAALYEDVELQLRLQCFVFGLGQKLARHPVVAGEQSAVDAEHGAGNPPRVVRREEHRSVRDVVRLAHATQWVPLDEALEDDRVAVDALLPDGGADGARGD